jgi:superfamily II DNA or RNA helicase
VLDEGIDVPKADLGIVLAASRRPRQMVQRMGRVLRRKSGRRARFVILYLEGSADDPLDDSYEGSATNFSTPRKRRSGSVPVRSDRQISRPD